MSILSRLLQKRGVEESELTGEEKVQFEQWKKTLAVDELNVDRIREFCQRMNSVIESKWRDLSVTKEQREELLPYHVVYNAILDVIDGSRVEREKLEEYLTKLIEQ